MNKNNFQNHVEAHSRVEKKLKCHICSTKFALQSSLKRHLVKCGNEKTNCDQCGKEVSFRFLLEHMQREHMGMLSPCKKCGKVFKWRQQLKRHLAAEHKDATNN